MTRAVIIVSLALSALLAAFWMVGAEGGGPSTADTYADAKGRYITAADAVCAAAGQQTDTGGHVPETPREQVVELRRAANAASRAAAALQALAPPPRDAAVLREEFIRPAEKLAARLTDFAAQAEKALTSGQEKTAAALAERSLESDGTEPTLSSFAQRYGFKTCAGE